METDEAVCDIALMEIGLGGEDVGDAIQGSENEIGGFNKEYLSNRIRSLINADAMENDGFQISSVRYLGFCEKRAQRCAMEMLRNFAPIPNDPYHQSIMGIGEDDYGEYSGEIIGFHKYQEDMLVWRPYMNYRPGIIDAQRTIIADTMIAVHMECGMHPATLYTAFHMMNCYLAKKTGLHKMGLVGLSALSAAYRFEQKKEVKAAFIGRILLGQYTEEEIRSSEKKVLAAVDVKYGIPTAYQFGRFYLSLFRRSKEHTDLTFYFMELGLRQYCFTGVQPSLLAAGALYAANWTFGYEEWPDILSTEITHSAIRVLYYAQILIKCQMKMRENKSGTCFNKYMHPYFSKVARYCPRLVILEFESSPKSSEVIKVYEHCVY